MFKSFIGGVLMLQFICSVTLMLQCWNQNQVSCKLTDSNGFWNKTGLPSIAVDFQNSKFNRQRMRKFLGLTMFSALKLVMNTTLHSLTYFHYIEESRQVERKPCAVNRQWKWGLYQTNRNTDGVIIVQPLHCVINIS